MVLSKTDRTLAIVDPSTLRVVAKAPAGMDPHEVTVSSDGRRAYVANYGRGACNTLTVVDLVAQKTAETVDLGALRGPHGLAFVDGGVWFTAEAAKAVGRYDAAARKVDLILGTGQNRSHMIHVSAGARRVVASNVNSATLTILDRTGQQIPQEEWDIATVPVGRGAEGFDVSPDGKEIWAANALDGTVSIVDGASKKVVETLHADVTSANRLKFTPDGRRVLVASLRKPEVVVFDAATRKEVKRVTVGTGGAGIQMQPDGRRAYVACTPDNAVVVIDLETLAVAGRIDAGPQPDGMAWAVQK